MADEDLAIAETELATPAIETEQEPVETELETEQAEAEQVEGEEGQEQAEEFEDIEIDGKTYSVPKELKGAFMKNADYTQKTQTHAERTKALEARDAEIEERSKATDEELDLRASLKTMDKTLAEYAKLTKEDWAAHRAADYIGTEDAWREYQDLKAQREETAKSLEGKQTERTQSAEKDLSNRVEQTLKFAKEKIPNWKPEHVGQMVELATELGIDEGRIKANWSPELYNLLHLANLGRQLVKKQSAPAPKTTPAVPATPLKIISAKSNPTNRGDVNRMSMAEHAALFEKEQKARKRG